MKKAKAAQVGTGETVRIDSKVTDSPIHEPSDSTLLWDSVCTLLRLLEGERLPYHNQSRRTKCRMWAIQRARGAAQRAGLYRDLLAVTRKSLGYIEAALERAACDPLKYMAWSSEVSHHKPLNLRAIDQTERQRRVLQGERVPAEEKIVSLFEAHTDIIVKSAREVQYGHKLNLAPGKYGLVLHVVIAACNPADSARFVPMLERHIERYGKTPCQIAADDGDASVENLRAAKRWQVEDVAYHKKRGVEAEAMAKSAGVYRKLWRLRAAISCLKRAYGPGRCTCTWKGLEHFKAYVWSSVVAHNLVLFTRLQME